MPGLGASGSALLRQSPAPVRCFDCGVQSLTRDGYRRELTTTGYRYRCPACEERRSRRDAEQLRIITIAFPIVGLAATALSWFFQPFLLPPSLIILKASLPLVCQPILVVAHELAHAVVARALGVRVFSITVGVGRPWFQGRFLGTRVRVNILPFTGVTRLGHVRKRGLRLRHWLSVAAGPMAHVLFILAMFAIWRESIGITAGGVGPDGDSWMPILFSLAGLFTLLNVVMLIGNLVPHISYSGGRPQPSDGLQLLRAPFMSQTQLDHLLATSFVFESADLQRESRYAEARACVEAGLKIWPAFATLRLDLGSILMIQGEFVAAGQAFRLALGLPENPSSLVAILESYLALSELAIGSAESLDEADRLSRQALAATGWNASAKVVRGAVLVERARHSEGAVLLREAFDGAGSLSSEMRATLQCYTAIALHPEAGDIAAQRLETARKEWPACPFLARAAQATTPHGAPTAS